MANNKEAVKESDNNKEAVKESDNNKECTICLEPIGWVYPAKPHVGSMCIGCAMEYDKKQKNDNKQTLDPATHKVMESCPYCEELMTAFNRSRHYSNCDGAPDDIKSKYKGNHTELFNEVMRNQISRERWEEYVTLRNSNDLFKPKP